MEQFFHLKMSTCKAAILWIKLGGDGTAPPVHYIIKGTKELCSAYQNGSSCASLTFIVMVADGCWKSSV